MACHLLNSHIPFFKPGIGGTCTNTKRCKCKLGALINTVTLPLGLMLLNTSPQRILTLWFAIKSQQEKHPSDSRFPLLTTSSGQKFGKSAGNAIWLDLEQTSSFELYKFFLGTADADVGRYLKLFTFMPTEQVHALVEKHMQSASQRTAQHTLAREFVELVHGEKEAKYAESQHRLIYAKKTMSSEEYAAAQSKSAALQHPSATSDPMGFDKAPAQNAELHNRLNPHLKTATVRCRARKT